MHGLWQTLAWFRRFAVGNRPSVFGFIIALAGFLLLFFHFQGKGRPLAGESFFQSRGSGFIVTVSAWLLNRDFPPGAVAGRHTLPRRLR